MYDFRAMGFSQSVCAGSNASDDCSRHSALKFFFFFFHSDRDIR